MTVKCTPEAGPPRYWWVVSKRMIHDCYEEDSRHVSFHDAMEALSKKEGEWRADWTLCTVYKGEFMVSGLILPPSESNKEAPKANGS